MSIFGGRKVNQLDQMSAAVGRIDQATSDLRHDVKNQSNKIDGLGVQMRAELQEATRSIKTELREIDSRVTSLEGDRRARQAVAGAGNWMAKNILPLANVGGIGALVLKLFHFV